MPKLAPYGQLRATSGRPFTGRLRWVTAMANWPETVDSVTKRDQLQRSAAPDPPIWRRSHPRWQGVPLVPNSNSIAISVTDGEFFDGMRFARTGWPGTHGPCRVCLAISGHALEDGLEAAGPGEAAEDSVEVCGWRRERLAG
jgi:hypothetical protein